MMMRLIHLMLTTLLLLWVLTKCWRTLIYYQQKDQLTNLSEKLGKIWWTNNISYTQIMIMNNGPQVKYLNGIIGSLLLKMIIRNN